MYPHYPVMDSFSDINSFSMCWAWYPWQLPIWGLLHERRWKAGFSQVSNLPILASLCNCCWVKQILACRVCSIINQNGHVVLRFCPLTELGMWCSHHPALVLQGPKRGWLLHISMKRTIFFHVHGAAAWTWFRKFALTHRVSLGNAGQTVF